ncbi:MAG: hypothetical protein OES84_02900 [Kiritimatiellaceae bacterium]|nr:hypothetical protein [Kiritimatiellaceae bacterium]
MDDLIGLIFFVVVAAVNLLAQANKKKKQREALAPEGEEHPRKEPNSIEEFFESLAEKLEPKPTELPEWPKNFERPDYMKEMEEFKTEPTAEIIPAPEPEQAPAIETKELPAFPMSHPPKKITASKSAMASMPSIVSNSQGMRIASTPMLRSQTGNNLHFSLRKRSELRKAIIANIIFSPPRAYDSTFENTTA